MTIVQKIESFNGNNVAFSTALSGTSFVSVHYGAGQGPYKTPGGVTGFYRIESSTALAKLATTFGSLSNAILYSRSGGTGPGGGSGGSNNGGAGAVPEPATWLQMIAGFGLLGAMQRRRRQALA